MNSYPLTIFWLKIFAIIGLEIGVVALLFASVQRYCRTATWRKTLCQAALVTSLLLAISELSGAGRGLMARLLRPTVNPNSRDLSSRVAEGQGTVAELGPDIRLQPNFRSEVMNRLAKNQTESSISKEGALIAQQQAPSFVIPKSPVTNHRLPISDSRTMQGLGLILGLGAAFVAGRACLGRLILVLLGARRRTIAESELSSRVRSLGRNFKMSRCVRIVESPRLASPIAFGFLRPTIGLPLNFCGRFSAVKQEVILIHELAHLAAHDPFWYFAADLVAAMLWWHPGVWWLRRQLQLSSELAADEASLMKADGPRVLAECLVEMGGRLTKSVAGQLRVAGFKSDLGCRVQRLMRLEGARWIPISRPRTIFARSIGPIAVAGTLILCTAWAVPRDLTKGDSMKTMKQNWQRAFATIITLAAIQTPTLMNGQPNPTAPAAAGQPAGAAPAYAPPPAQDDTSSPDFARRYGLPSGAATPAANPFAPQGAPGTPPRGGKLEAKLKEIVLDEVKLEGLPLNEVLNFLSDESRKRDPEKKGINFLLNPNPPLIQAAISSVDPATGLPIAGPIETIDISSISVKFNIPLRHVTMADVLDAVVRVADRPIQYAVEDYAVIFSLRADGNFVPQRTERVVGTAPLAVRTFHVDTNTFVAGLESAFGIKVESKGKDSQSRKIQSALKELLVQLNVSMEGNKGIFYNELTGTVMVRVAAEDLDVIQAAIETLGGQPLSGYAMGFVPGVAMVPGVQPSR
jgi:beta-lactamase regulating signal transducer with metallopeptidase domain